MSINVSITACGDYSPEHLDAALAAVLEPLGGLDWVQSGMTIAIKTNLVSRMSPESAAVTHPEAVAALTRMLVSRGAHVIVGDSPGGPYTAAWVHSVYHGAGIDAVERAGGELNEDFETEEVRFPEGKTAKSFSYTSWLKKADAIIDFAKLKTHGMAGMTCAVKNFFGSIPGTRKPEMHYLYPNTPDFCSMLVDLALYNAPRLTIVDAVDCMEGNGPTQGEPRHMGAILAADTPFNADLVCAHLIGMEAADAPTVAESISRGLCPADWHDLAISGDPDEFALPDFKRLPVGGKIDFRTRIPIVSAFMRRGFGTGPKVDKAKCVGCGKCAEVCPAKAAHVVNGKAQIDAKKCIRCFCCQEFCPKGAVSVHRPLLARLLG
ncbi:MAG TPA: DUF362 domain-containing protein [Candidatus Scatomorpha merdigallinarum]|nr:DUF362 domain-containing protein [Candidatus Scatomorpha merdigallinarum]